jgi:hypothetical protein
VDTTLAPALGEGFLLGLECIARQDGDAMIKRVWIEYNDGQAFDPKRDSADVLVETDDELLWTASFVTIPYLQRQMELSREVAKDVDNMPLVRFIAIETPHVIVDDLSQDTIEDTIDNLMTLGVFEGVFTLYSEDAPVTGADGTVTDSTARTTTLKG